MTCIFSLGFFFILCLSCCQADSYSRFTSLDIDNHPCKPENLKHTKRYICDAVGKVICQSGWREPELQDEITELNPCLEPICNQNGLGCVHGECREPNFCACEVGWEGPNCDRCVPLPGCSEHGSCVNAFECNCQNGWAGAYCDIAECGDCQNGDCVGPNECVCHSGWTGQNCTQCQKMHGCVNGVCDRHPHTCKCLSGWEGHLCDKPVCSLDCVHGVCETTTVNGTAVNFCVCENGWRGESCEKCRPYWRCPNQGTNACVKPNQCICNGTESDPDHLCGNEYLNNHNNYKNQSNHSNQSNQS